MLVSSEELVVIPPEEFERRTRFDGHTKRIIIFLRRQDEVLESTYLQLVHAGLCADDFNSYLNNVLEGRNEDYATLCYDDLLERWASVFGRENLSVLIYESNKPDRFLYESFLRTIQVRLTESFEIPPHLNRAIHAVVAEYLRGANKAGRNNGRHRALVADAASRLGLSGRKVPLLSKSQRAAVLELFGEQNRRVADMYFRASQGILFVIDDVPAEPPHFELRNYTVEYEHLLKIIKMLE